MKKLIYGINVTLDGRCDHTQAVPDEEVFRDYIDLLEQADQFVFGRKTYQLMVPYWPNAAKDPGSTKAEVEYGKAFVAKKMVVVSRSLEEIEGKDARIIRRDLRDEILRLKQEKGKDVLTGGVELPMRLMELGLIDEYRFVVLPILAGEGRRLWEGTSLPEKFKLKLVESKTYGSGSVLLRYLKQ